MRVAFTESGHNEPSDEEGRQSDWRGSGYVPLGALVYISVATAPPLRASKPLGTLGMLEIMRLEARVESNRYNICLIQSHHLKIEN